MGEAGRLGGHEPETQTSGSGASAYPRKRAVRDNKTPDVAGEPRRVITRSSRVNVYARTVQHRC